MSKLMRFPPLLTLMLVAGCGTLSKDECATADWRQIGEGDGASGQQNHYLDQHRKSCRKHGIAVDPESYYDGRREGLRRFCRTDQGYALGLDGDEYFGVCPQDRAREFQHSYVKGLALKQDQLEIQYQQANNELSTRRLERALLSKRGDNEALDEAIEELQSKRQSLLDERLKLQRWIARWSQP